MGGVKLQKLLFFPKAVGFRILTSFLKYYLKVLRVIDVCVVFENKVLVIRIGEYFAANYLLLPS